MIQNPARGVIGRAGPRRRESRQTGEAPPGRPGRPTHAGRPGLSLVLRDLLDFAGDEFHLADATAFQGRPFGAALLGHATSCVAGLLTAEGRTVLNPCPRAVIIEPDSRLIVVTRDETSAGAEDCRHLVDPSARTAAAAPAGDAVRRLLLGWNRRAPLVIGQLRDTARPGSFSAEGSSISLRPAGRHVRVGATATFATWWRRHATPANARSATVVATGGRPPPTTVSASTRTRVSAASGARRIKWSSWQPNPSVRTATSAVRTMVPTGPRPTPVPHRPYDASE
ncbi:CASTOR/POLLUX-related putative ion channel [Streptomyces sp. NPDC005046]